MIADAFDTEQLLECMGQQKRDQAVNVPVYGFKKYYSVLKALEW